MTNLDAVPFFKNWRGGRIQTLGGARISGWGTGSLFSVALCHGLKVFEGLAFGEDAKLEFIACYIEEGVFWAKDLTEEGMVKFVNPRPWDAHEGEFYWKKRNGDLHNPRRGTRK